MIAHAATSGRASADDLSGLRGLASSLNEEGRAKDALVLFEHIATLQPDDAETLRQLARILGSQGRTLEAIERLAALKAVSTDCDALVGEIRLQMPAAFKMFNDHVAAGEVEQAETYASALASLVPGNVALLDSALSCNVLLGRKDQAAKYARALLAVDASHAAARAAIAAASAAAANVHPLIRLRDIHDAASLILCGELNADAIAKVDALLKAAADVVIDVPTGSEWEGWAKHYRLAIAALDLPAVLGPTPALSKESKITLATSTGTTLDWAALKARAKRLGAKTVFFAAADKGYVDLYARWYVKSILKHCDVPCLVVVHVIGGAKELKTVAKSIGINDPRLVFAGDGFVAHDVTTKCYDTPPKGLIAMPVAHFQSVRFLRLGTLLQQLKLPVFVSDIDVLLQRGVDDLLQRCAGADVVFNENAQNTNAGSRLTANLVLVNPTGNAALFLRFLRGYLERALGGAEVSRWIDQFALLMARHHLARNGDRPKLEYFDTNSDINNVMYKSYQEHPFRFLSLYHGFDTSSLEANPNVLGEKPRRAKKKLVKAAKKAARARRM